MDVDVELDGAQQLLARLARAHAGLLDLTDVNRTMAQLVERQATADSPRATGKLAGSAVIAAGPQSWGVNYTVPYAMPVHFGTAHMRARPWLTTAARDTEELWMRDLTEHVQQLLD